MIDLVTGYAASNHITADKMRLGNCGIVGAGDYVLANGNKLAATITSNNLVTISDGDIMMQGGHISIAPGTTETATIATGTANMKRNDIICCRYSKNTATGVETASIVVVKGTETSGTPTDPSTTSGKLSEGAVLHQMPLYRVNINGLTIVSIDVLFHLSVPISQIAGVIYPVGGIYLSTSSISPATLFGGIWQQIKGRFLLAADNTYGAGTTGGEASHTLSTEEMPSHFHNVYNGYTGGGTSFGSYAAKTDYTDSAIPDGYTASTTSAGGGKPHNNMPPYLAVYMWARTA